MSNVFPVTDNVCVVILKTLKLHYSLVLPDVKKKKKKLSRSETVGPTSHHPY